MELGGNIELVGFEHLDVNELILVKKLVGTYTKDFSDANEAFERITVTLAQREPYIVSAEVQAGDKTLSCTHESVNLYFALDGCLKELVEQ